MIVASSCGTSRINPKASGAFSLAHVVASTISNWLRAPIFVTNDPAHTVAISYRCANNVKLSANLLTTALDGGYIDDTAMHRGTENATQTCASFSTICSPNFAASAFNTLTTARFTQLIRSRALYFRITRSTWLSLCDNRITPPPVGCSSIVAVSDSSSTSIAASSVTASTTLRIRAAPSRFSRIHSSVSVPSALSANADVYASSASDSNRSGRGAAGLVCAAPAAAPDRFGGMNSTCPSLSSDGSSFMSVTRAPQGTPTHAPGSNSSESAADRSASIVRGGSEWHRNALDSVSAWSRMFSDAHSCFNASIAAIDSSGEYALACSTNSTGRKPASSTSCLITVPTASRIISTLSTSTVLTIHDPRHAACH
mmetsp:Transcript_10361/g.21814  ORF Transcript_10361/g.21814 Transcript_10361/m.21814 type:complete len:370 (-) Transcript_10361:24-1133(-)